MSAEQVPIVRTAMDSFDFDEVRELITRRYVNHEQRVVGRADDFMFRSRTLSAGDLVVDQPIYRACMSFETEPFETLLIASVLEGRYHVNGGSQQGQAQAGEVLMYPSGVDLDIVLDRSRQWVVQLPMEAVHRVAARFGVEAADFRFDAATPVSPAAGRRWADTAVYLARMLNTPGEENIHPLLLASAIETAASTAVTVFPNTTMTLNYLADPNEMAPAAVRRAAAYMDAHAADPITLHDIAGAAGLGVRALQSAFRRHLDVSPIGYLHRVRLEHTHRELKAADPGSATVAAIANRWGFAHLGRFAASYRRAYGQHPSRTLRV